MHVEIRRYRQGKAPEASAHEVRGVVRLDAHGKVAFDEGASWIKDLSISGPDGTVSPGDGEAYLRALPRNFRTPYCYAVLVEDIDG